MSHSDTGSLPYYLQANCLSPEQMKVWWAKQAREQEQDREAKLLEMAEIVHKARWPEDRQMDITPFADEDKNGRDYCIRIARAVLAALPKAKP